MRNEFSLILVKQPDAISSRKSHSARPRDLEASPVLDGRRDPRASARTAACAHVRCRHFHSSASFPGFLRRENNAGGVWRRGYLAQAWPGRGERRVCPSRRATHVEAPPPLVAHLAVHSRPDNQLYAKGTSSRTLYRMCRSRATRGSS